MEVFVFLFSLLIYVSSAFPAAPPEDSQEFIVASYTLGIPHPPGYPAVILVYRFFSIIIPFGSFTLKMNLITSIITAFSILYLYKTIKIILDHHTLRQPFFIINDFLKIAASSIAALLISLSRIIWYLSTFIEVYPLAIFFTSFTLYLILKSYFENNIRTLAAAIFVYGFAVITHPTTIFLFPLFIVAIIKHKKAIPYFIFVFFISLTILFYIPFRHDAFLTTGDPSILKGFLRIITRADYGSFKLYEGGGDSAFSLKFFLVAHIVDLVFIIFIAGVYGVFVYSDLKIKLAAVLIYILSGFFYFILARAPSDPYFKGVLERFMWLSEISIAVFSGVALYRVFLFRKAFIYLAVSFIVFEVFSFYRKNFNRYNFVTADYRTSIYRTLNTGIVFSPSDTLSFSILYETAFRTDRIKQVVYHKTHWGLRKIANELGVDKENFFNSIIKKYGSELYFELPKSYEELPEILRKKFPQETYSTGMLYSYAPLYDGVLLKTWFNVSEFVFFRNLNTGDYFTLQLIKRFSENFTNIQAQFDLNGIHEYARTIGIKSILTYETPENLNNMGVTYFHLGEYPRSAYYFKKSAQLKKDARTIYNLYLAYKKFDFENAMRALKEACVLSNNEDWIFELARELYIAGKYVDALSELEGIRKKGVREYKLKMEIAKSLNDPGLIKEIMGEIKENLGFLEQLEVISVLK